MRLLRLVLATLALTIATGAHAAPPANGAPFAIVNAHVLDGSGAEPTDATIVVRNGLIETVVDRPPANMPTVDAKGGWIVPGFIDMHAHLLAPRCTPAPDGSRFDRAASEQAMRAYLDFGVTFVRSPATPTVEGLAFRDDLDAGRVPGPRATASAELINDAKLTPEQIEEIMRAALPHRPDYFKAYAALSPEQVGVMVKFAHAHGVPVIGHLGRTSWREGAELGIDYVTHAVDWSAQSLSPEARERYAAAIRERGAIRARIDWLELFDPEGPEATATLDALRLHHISVDPTLLAYDTKFGAPRGGRYRADAYARRVPALFANWESCTHIVDDWTPDDFARWRAAWPKLLRWVRRMADADIVLTTGTDFTNPWVIPGRGLHQEFALLREAGFTPREILRMTGLDAAAALERQDIGLIAAGRRADLVLLRANPLDDIANTQAIAWVMQGGRIVSHGPNAAP